MPGRLFVISGPSGAGKGTLVQRITSRRNGLWLSVSATTRLPRKDEIDGQSYFFLTTDQFEQKISEGDFLEWAKVHDNYYGTLRSQVDSHIASSEDVILEIDVQGGLQVKKNFPDAYLIFVRPVHFEDLIERLEGRGAESFEQIQRRLETARVEMEYEKCYNYTLVNDNLEEATQELLDFIDSPDEMIEKSRGFKE